MVHKRLEKWPKIPKNPFKHELVVLVNGNFSKRFFYHPPFPLDSPKESKMSNFDGESALNKIKIRLGNGDQLEIRNAMKAPH